MGCDKALLEIRGQPLIQNLADAALAVTDEVLIAADDGRPYAFLDFPVIPDMYPGHGPLAGLHAAMRHSTRDRFLLLACDLPNVRAETLRRLIVSCSPDRDVIVPRSADGRSHPLCAVYRRTSLPFIERNLKSGANKVLDLVRDPGLRVHFLDPGAGCFQDSDFLNLNSKKDLEEYLRTES